MSVWPQNCTECKEKSPLQDFEWFEVESRCTRVLLLKIGILDTNFEHFFRPCPIHPISRWHLKSKHRPPISEFFLKNFFTFFRPFFSTYFSKGNSKSKIIFFILNLVHWQVYRVEKVGICMHYLWKKSIFSFLHTSI